MKIIKLSYDIPLASEEYKSLRYNAAMCRQLEAITKFIPAKALANQGIAQQNQLIKEQDIVINKFSKEVVSYHRVHGQLTGVMRILGLNSKKEIVFDAMTCGGFLWGNEDVKIELAN